MMLGEQSNALCSLLLWCGFDPHSKDITIHGVGSNPCETTLVPDMVAEYNELSL